MTDHPSHSTRLWVVVSTVTVALVLSGVHGVTHAVVPVHLPLWQYAVATGFVFVGPLLAVVLVATGRAGPGLWTLLVAGVASLGFEWLAHFVVENPDHVASVESGLFSVTALLTTAGDVLLVVVGAWLLWTRGELGTVEADVEASA